MPIAALIVKIAADTSELVRGTQQVSNQLSDFGDMMSKAFSFAAIGVSAAAFFGAFKSFMVDAIQSATEAEQAQRRLTAALQAQGGAVPQTTRAYNALAAEFQRTTVFSDDLITEMQALLVQVGNVMPSQMRAALTASTDLASGLGIDLRQATMLVGKAFAGETSTLKRYGIVVDEAALAGRGVEAVLAAINQQFGGQATAQAETYAGAMAQLANEWDNLKEEVGGILVNDPHIRAFMSGAADGAVTATAAFVKFVNVVQVLQAALDDFRGVTFISNLVSSVGELPRVAGPATQSMQGFTAASAASTVTTDRLSMALAEEKYIIQEANKHLQQTIQANQQAARATAAFQASIGNLSSQLHIFTQQLMPAVTGALVAETTRISEMTKAGIEGAQAIAGVNHQFGVLPGRALGVEQAMYGAAGAIDTVNQMTRALPPEAAPARVAITSLDQAVKGLSQSFAVLGSISGGQLGAFAQALGQIVGSIDLAKTAATNLKGSVDQVAASFAGGQLNLKNFGLGLTGVVSNVMSVVAAMDQATRSSNRFMNVLGGAATGAQAGSAFGPWGTLIGGVGGALFGLFRGIGGPSAQEVAGRDAAAAFRQELIGLMTDADRLEAQTLILGGANATWAQSTVTVKNAYIAAGLTAEQALADMDALWRAEAQGADAVAAAMIPIQDALRRAQQAGQTATDVIADGSTDAVPAIDDMAAAAGVVGMAVEDVTARMQVLDGMIIANIPTWTTWRDAIVKAAEDAAAAVNAVSFGSSPGGIKEIPIQLERARQAMLAFEADAVDRFDAAREVIDGRGRRRAATSAPARFSGGGGGLSVTVNFHGIDATSLTASTVKRDVIPPIIEAIKANYRGARDQMQTALGLT